MHQRHETGSRVGKGRGERGDAWVLRSKGTHAQCPSTRSTPNATLAQSRPVAVPGTHLAITSFPAAVSGRSVAGLKGMGGAVHCSGLHRLETAQAAFGTFVLHFFIVGFGSTVFLGPLFPSTYAVGTQ